MEKGQSHLEDFLGVYSQKVDEKKRVVLPADWRPVITKRNPSLPRFMLYLTFGSDHIFPFVDIYDPRGYEAARPNLAADEVYRKEPDAQHRFILPDLLMRHARLKEDVMIAAALDMNHMRIWEPVLYDQWKQAHHPSTKRKSEGQ